MFENFSSVFVIPLLIIIIIIMFIVIIFSRDKEVIFVEHHMDILIEAMRKYYSKRKTFDGFCFEKYYDNKKYKILEYGIINIENNDICNDKDDSNGDGNRDVDGNDDIHKVKNMNTHKPQKNANGNDANHIITEHLEKDDVFRIILRLDGKLAYGKKEPKKLKKHKPLTISHKIYKNPIGEGNLIYVDFVQTSIF